ncbi:MAG: hypothetical protein MUF49_27625 [Oculatellaceae cyanobacterium Prado106]|jgi:hypothetical protein|nr:hypothetical protein [Oculatellaceae cyanobacterium Prado106]
MVSVTPTQPRRLEAKVTLQGVSWQTFKLLMNDLEDQDYRIIYAPELLEIIEPLAGLDLEAIDVEDLCVLTLRGIRWSTYKTLMAEVGNGRA